MIKAILIKTMFAACIMVVITYASDAQIKFGARAGLNLSTIGGDDTGENTVKLGYNIGGLLYIGISDNFSVQPELLFSTKGTQDKDKPEVKKSLNYIDIPVMANYKLENGIYFEAGPTFDFLISANDKDGTNTVDVKDYVNGTDIGIGLGAGYMMKSGLGFGARYEMGFTNINKTGDAANHNSVIMINMVYLFGNAD